LSNAVEDHLVLLQIEGMHCHRCEKVIKQALGKLPGVHEVEVDFLSGQASVLHTQGSVRVDDLKTSIVAAGYRVTGFIEKQNVGKSPS